MTQYLVKFLRSRRWFVQGKIQCIHSLLRWWVLESFKVSVNLFNIRKPAYSFLAQHGSKSFHNCMKWLYMEKFFTIHLSSKHLRNWSELDSPENISKTGMTVDLKLEIYWPITLNYLSSWGITFLVRKSIQFIKLQTRSLWAKGFESFKGYFCVSWWTELLSLRIFLLKEVELSF